MKLLVILLIPLTCFCQQQPGQVFSYTNTGFVWNTTYLSSVSDIISCSTAKGGTLVITDTLRGGEFVRYTGSNPVDNGMIFQDAIGSITATANIANKMSVRIVIYP